MTVLSITSARASSVAQGRCETGDDRTRVGLCGKPAAFRYPSMGGGYMRMCKEHGEKHAKYCERWTAQGWTKP